MASVNEVRIIGNLGANPDLRHTQTGRSVATLSVATNRRWEDDNGKKHEETTWHRVVVWAKQAENVAKFCSKGDPVYVAGRLATRTYTDNEGVERYAVEVIAQSVQFLKPAPGSNRPPHPADESGGSAGGPPPGDDDMPPPPDDDDVPF